MKRILTLLSVFFVFPTTAQDNGYWLKTRDLNTFRFRSLGPALTSGRVADFAVNPDNRAEYYVAVASGGVWKTTNAGTTYEPIFDSYGSYSIGCVTMDPNNSNVIWVGTGENNNQRSVAYGDGFETQVNPTDPNIIYVQSQYGYLVRYDRRSGERVDIKPMPKPGEDALVYNWDAPLIISPHQAAA